MSKQTLLNMTQEILSAMSSDEVNSIGDTSESLQVATILKRKYYDIASRGDLPEHNQLFQLNPSLSGIEPTLMFIPDGIGHVEWIKYFNSNPDSGTSLIPDTDDIVNQIPAAWTTTSTTSVTIGLGLQTFSIPSGLVIGLPITKR